MHRAYQQYNFELCSPVQRSLTAVKNEGTKGVAGPGQASHTHVLVHEQRLQDSDDAAYHNGNRQHASHSLHVETTAYTKVQRTGQISCFVLSASQLFSHGSLSLSAC
jgi:hypothetical protein